MNRTTVLLVAVVASLSASFTAVAQSPVLAGSAVSAKEKKPVALPVDREKLVTHLEKHVDYPADRAAILAACAQTEEFTTAQKEWFAKRLPEGKYASAAEVVKATGI